jgi:hypothetical protein
MRIKQGDTPLEQSAIDAQLERLSLKKSVVGTVDDPEIRQSKVSGGAKAVEQAGGVRSELDLDALAQLHEKQGLRGLLPKKDPAIATKAQINSAADLVRGASSSVVALVDRISRAEEMDMLGELVKVSDRLSQAATALETAMDKEVLAHATSADVKTLQQGYKDFLTGWGVLGKALAKALQNLEPLEFNHMTGLFAIAGGHKAATTGQMPKGNAISDLAAKEIASAAARLLEKAPFFEVGHAHVTTRSTAQAHDSLAAQIWDWSMKEGFVAGPYMLTLTQEEKYADQHNLPRSEVHAAVSAIRSEQDVYGRLRRWTQETEKPMARFFFTLSEMDQAGKDIGASTKDVMRALDLAEEIAERNAKKH